MRGTGSGAAASIGRLAEVIAPTATPLLYAYGGLAAAFTIFALFHIVGPITVAVLGMETKGKVLEEIDDACENPCIHLTQLEQDGTVQRCMPSTRSSTLEPRYELPTKTKKLLQQLTATRLEQLIQVLE